MAKMMAKLATPQKEYSGVSLSRSMRVLSSSGRSFGFSVLMLGRRARRCTVRNTRLDGADRVERYSEQGGRRSGVVGRKACIGCVVHFGLGTWGRAIF